MNMSKFIVVLLAVLAALTASGADLMPYHPFRKLGTNYYDLRPLYAWCHSQSSPRPFRTWLAPVNGQRFTVTAVLEPDLLQLDWSVPAGNGNRKSFPIVLKGYPAHDTATDGEGIEFLASKVGT
jgi:hypothetical protein